MSAPELVIPQNQSAEQGALACLLREASVYHAPLCEAHFAAPDHKLVFRAVRELADNQKPVTIQSIRALLESRGELDHAGGDPARFFNYGGGGNAVLADHFFHLENARRNREAVLHIRANLADLTSLRLDAAAFAEELSEMACPVNVDTEGDSVADIIAEKEARLLRGESKEVFPSGLAPLDRHIEGGFVRGELGVFGGNTGDGKSALLVQTTARIGESERKVRYFTLELGKEEVTDRMACALRGTTMRDEKRFRSALMDLYAMPIKIHQRFTELAEIVTEIRAAVRAGDCDLAVVDYVQRVGIKADTRELEVSTISRTLKNVARRENIVVLTASQLNDNGQLRESRAIGHDADFVFTITENGLRVDKCRRGPRDVLLPCHLLGAQSRFVATAREAR